MASTATEGLTFGGLLASASLAASQYKIVKLASTAGEVIVGAAATDGIVGVLLNDPAAGEEALYQFAGIAKVLAEASVSRNDKVACSTTGRAKTTTSANDRVLGFAIDASASAGDLIRVQLSIHNF